MDRQLKHSPLDSVHITDRDLHPKNSSTETAFTSTAAAQHQDSPFFRLPLELRYMIYNALLDPQGNNYIIVEPPNAVEALFLLSRLSRQIRAETQTLVANTRICVLAGLTKQLVARPYTTLLKTSDSSGTTKLQTWSEFNIEAPREPKFWKIVLSLIDRSGQTRFIADIDFRERTVRVLGPGDEVDCPLYTHNWLFPKSTEESSRILVQNFERYATNTTKILVERKGFLGLTFIDIHPLLRSLKTPWPAHIQEYGELFEHPW
ncbi:hypothetical protein QM012_000211 [Aureobasidium pullulans]|uniref:F-box domain-containing protein n=1 Tax=Aureobasidium pullulans TaxID=5580 RepID=A0ABR0TUY3_AURPU